MKTIIMPIIALVCAAFGATTAFAAKPDATAPPAKIAMTANQQASDAVNAPDAMAPAKNSADVWTVAINPTAEKTDVKADAAGTYNAALAMNWPAADTNAMNANWVVNGYTVAISANANEKAWTNAPNETDVATTAYINIPAATANYIATANAGK